MLSDSKLLNISSRSSLRINPSPFLSMSSAIATTLATFTPDERSFCFIDDAVSTTDELIVNDNVVDDDGDDDNDNDDDDNAVVDNNDDDDDMMILIMIMKILTTRR